MNKIYHHPENDQMQVEVILASRHADYPDEKPLYTLRARYPRIIHGEIMTHRDFSRNARSSRAVPVKTMLNEVRTIPFVPWHWGKNQKGMQSGEECNEMVCMPVYDGLDTNIESMSRETAWLEARNNAVTASDAMMRAGYHKQNVNRLLEPFSWIDTLITSSKWSNFLWLRDHEHAEPHLSDLARLIDTALKEAEIKELKLGEWHRPYITKSDLQSLIIRPDEPTKRMIDELGCSLTEILNMVSAARCARISYKPFNGDSTYEAELQRYEDLTSGSRIHASPTEHQATPDCKKYLHANEWNNTRFHGNLPHWIQARKLIDGENHVE